MLDADDVRVPAEAAILQEIDGKLSGLHRRREENRGYIAQSELNIEHARLVERRLDDEIRHWALLRFMLASGGEQAAAVGDPPSEAALTAATAAQRVARPCSLCVEPCAYCRPTGGGA